MDLWHFFESYLLIQLAVKFIWKHNLLDKYSGRSGSEHFKS